VSFSIINSPVGQDSPPVFIQARGTRPVGAPVILQQGGFEPVTIGETPINPAPGNARPMLIGPQALSLPLSLPPSLSLSLSLPNPKPQTPNPKPQTPNLKPYTLNPKP